MQTLFAFCIFAFAVAVNAAPGGGAGAAASHVSAAEASEAADKEGTVLPNVSEEDKARCRQFAQQARAAVQLCKAPKAQADRSCDKESLQSFAREKKEEFKGQITTEDSLCQMNRAMAEANRETASVIEEKKQTCERDAGACRDQCAQAAVKVFSGRGTEVACEELNAVRNEIRKLRAECRTKVGPFSAAAEEIIANLKSEGDEASQAARGSCADGKASATPGTGTDDDHPRRSNANRTNTHDITPERVTYEGGDIDQKAYDDFMKQNPELASKIHDDRTTPSNPEENRNFNSYGQQEYLVGGTDDIRMGADPGSSLSTVMNADGVTIDPHSSHNPPSDIVLASAVTEVKPSADDPFGPAPVFSTPPTSEQVPLPVSKPASVVAPATTPATSPSAAPTASADNGGAQNGNKPQEQTRSPEQQQQATAPTVGGASPVASSSPGVSDSVSAPVAAGAVPAQQKLAEEVPVAAAAAKPEASAAVGGAALEKQGDNAEDTKASSSSDPEFRNGRYVGGEGSGGGSGGSFGGGGGFNPSSSNSDSEGSTSTASATKAKSASSSGGSGGGGGGSRSSRRSWIGSVMDRLMGRPSFGSSAGAQTEETSATPGRLPQFNLPEASSARAPASSMICPRSEGCHGPNTEMWGAISGRFHDYRLRNEFLP